MCGGEGGFFYHLHELVRGHGFPELVEEGAVVDAEGGGDAFFQALPVFAVVAVGPFVDGGHAALHFCERGWLTLLIRLVRWECSLGYGAERE